MNCWESTFGCRSTSQGCREEKVKPNQETAHLSARPEDGLDQCHFSNSRIPKYQYFSTVISYISDNSLDVRTGTITCSVDGRLFEDTELERRFQTPTKKEPEGIHPETSFLSLSLKWLDYPHSQKCSTVKGSQSLSSLHTNREGVKAGVGEGGESASCRKRFCEEGSR